MSALTEASYRIRRHSTKSSFLTYVQIVCHTFWLFPWADDFLPINQSCGPLADHGVLANVDIGVVIVIIIIIVIIKIIMIIV